MSYSKVKEILSWEEKLFASFEEAKDYIVSVMRENKIDDRDYSLSSGLGPVHIRCDIGDDFPHYMTPPICIGETFYTWQDWLDWQNWNLRRALTEFDSQWTKHPPFPPYEGRVPKIAQRT